jgi:hypothetical protein
MGSGDLGGGGDVEFWRAEAKRLAADNVVLQTRVADLEGQVGCSPRRCMLARLALGTSSEKAVAKPTPLVAPWVRWGPGPPRRKPELPSLTRAS